VLGIIKDFGIWVERKLAMQLILLISMPLLGLDTTGINNL
jgi:hypothetical protein